MFNVIETTRTFKVDGSLKSETHRTVFSSADPVECLRWRYAKADGGHSVSFIRDVSVTLTTQRDGKPFGFADLFLLVEGQAAYDAVMNDEAPAQVESEWLAARPIAPEPAPANTYQERVNRFRILRHDDLPESHKAAYLADGIDPADLWSLIWSFETEEAALECLAQCRDEAASWQTFKLVDNGEASTITRTAW